MKRINLNTIFICLLIIISFTFFILFYYSINLFDNYRNFSYKQIENNIKFFSNSMFKVNVSQQATIAESEFQNASKKLKYIGLKTKFLLNNKNNSSTLNFSDFQNKNKLYTYISDFSIINDLNYGIIINALKDKNGNIPNVVKEKIQKLYNLAPTFKNICSKTNHSFSSVYILSRDGYYIALSEGPELTSKLYGFDFINKVIPQLFDEVKSQNGYSFTKVFLNYRGSLEINVKMPVYISGQLEYIVGISIAYDQLIKWMYSVFSKYDYDDYNFLRLMIDKNGNIIYINPKKIGLFSLLNEKNEIINNEKMSKNIYALHILNRSLLNTIDPNVKKLVKMILKDKVEEAFINLKGERYKLISTEIPISNWYMAVLVKTKELYAPLNNAKNMYNTVIKNIYEKYFLSFAITLVLCIGLSFFFFRNLIIKPARKIILNFLNLGKGNFSTKIKEQGINEIYELSKTYNILGNKLSNYTSKLEREIKNRQTIETELKIASSIQNSVLPRINNQFCNDIFKIYAKCIPAKEMSGDFYDFFYLDKENVAFVLADVSGKGIAAAFYMSRAKAIIKSFCLTQQEDLNKKNMTTNMTTPGSILQKVNNFLSKDNDSCMFLTMYLCFYNISSGKLSYSNAGHHEMLHLTNGKQIVPINTQNQCAVGIYEDIQYKTEELTLNPKDSLILYTDGIIEAPDINDIEFGTERLITLISQNIDQSLNSLKDTIIDNVLKYQDNNRFDDITILMFQRNSI